jgi:L-threonylcarbamoyladenylate synthase
MGGAALTGADAHALQDCLARGGVAVFPADTVYGLACDPCSREAVKRLYELKGRPAAKPAAVMWFSLEPALRELGDLPPLLRSAVQALLPGPVTLLLPNSRRRFPLACEPGRADGGLDARAPSGVETSSGSPPSLRPPPVGIPVPLGVRVPAWPAQLAALGAVGVPALQSSANLSGDLTPQTLTEVPQSILAGADLVIDGGELRGVASTVIDLHDYEARGAWRVVRQGALSEAKVAQLLADDAR